MAASSGRRSSSPPPSTRRPRSSNWSARSTSRRRSRSAAGIGRPNTTPPCSACTLDDIEERIVNVVGGGCRQGAYTNDQWGYNRPFPEASGYRTPIDGLYLCGSACHPGGSIHFGAGYNAANAIVTDLGMERWW